MAESPTLTSDGLVVVSITSNGTAIPDTYEVISVRTRNESGRIPEAVVVLADGDVSTEEFPITDGDRFPPGAEIGISATYDDGELVSLFKGIVTSVRIRTQDSQSRLEVTCRDKAIRMTLSRHSAVREAQKDSDILSTLISDAGLTADVEATTIEHPVLVQSRCTDWDFLLTRADANGFTVNVFEGKVAVKAPAPDTAAVLTVTYGLDIISFDMEVDARHQYATYSVESWDPANLKKLSTQESPSAGPKIGNLTPTALAEVGGNADILLTTSAPVDASDLTVIAKARATRTGLSALRGFVVFQGSGLAKPGETLEIKGLGDRFSGTGLIGSVFHTIEDGSWQTEVGLGLKSHWHSDRPDEAESPAAAGLVPPVSGLQLATVTKIDEDPDGMFRIQVSLTLVGGDDNDALIWARYSSPYASNGVGLVTLPEIGDEVVVGFLDDNPTYPIILGSLHGSSQALPITPAAENNTKTFLTREKLKLEFDEGNKVITVETPGGNKVVLDDTDGSITMTDKNGNSVTLDSSGITLDSASDISLKAKANISVTAGSDATVSGMNVTLSADTALKAAGNASAELSAGGTTKVAGAMVQIN